MRVNSKVYHRRHGWGLVVGRAPDIPGALLVSFDNHLNRSLSKVVKKSELSAREEAGDHSALLPHDYPAMENRGYR